MMSICPIPPGLLTSTGVKFRKTQVTSVGVICSKQGWDVHSFLSSGMQKRLLQAYGVLVLEDEASTMHVFSHAVVCIWGLFARMDAEFLSILCA